MNIDIKMSDLFGNNQEHQHEAIEPLAAPQQRSLETVTQHDDEKDDIILKYGAKQVMMIFVPVSACMLLVVINLSLIKSYQSGNGVYLYVKKKIFGKFLFFLKIKTLFLFFLRIYTPFQENTNEASTKLWQSMANASIFIGVVIAMTIILILLYKYSFYKVIHCWLAFSSLLLLFLFTYMYVRLVRNCIHLFYASNLNFPF